MNRRCAHCRGPMFLELAIDSQGRQHEELNCLACGRVAASSLTSYTARVEAAITQQRRRASL